MADNPEGAVSVEHLCRFPQAATVIFRVRHLPGSAQRHLCCCTDSTPIPSCNTCPTFVWHRKLCERTFIHCQPTQNFCVSKFSVSWSICGSVRLQRINDTLHAMPSLSGEPGRTLTKTKKNMERLSSPLTQWCDSKLETCVLEPSRIFPTTEDLHGFAASYARSYPLRDSRLH